MDLGTFILNRIRCIKRKLLNKNLGFQTIVDSANMVEEVIPWCRPCDQFHQESTFYIANQVIEHGTAEVGNQETTSGESDHVYMVG